MTRIVLGRGLRRFNEEFAGCTDDAIRPKKSERPPRYARHEAGGEWQAADRRPFVEPVKSSWYARRLLAVIQGDGDGHDRESGGQAYWAGEVGRVRRSGAMSESYFSPFTK
jgi:hypothetical protein